jgi:threonine/homoserine/homoserine lactone efflux protein
MGFVGSVPLTGPIALLVFHRGLQGRYWRGIAVGLGGTTGELIYCAMAVAGVGALVKQFPLASAGLKTMSALILIAFGLYFLIAPPNTKVEETTKVDHASDTWHKDFGQGFMISAFNPILLLNWTAAVAIVYSMIPVELDLSAKASFVAGAGLGVGGWFSLLVVILRYFKRELPEGLIGWVQRAMGAIVLVAAALPIHDVLSGLS